MPTSSPSDAAHLPCVADREEAHRATAGAGVLVARAGPLSDLSAEGKFGDVKASIDTYYRGAQQLPILHRALAH